jgi:pyruvate/2-oxoglutarate dehydrogenase complex dihydrolipoamide acyltransferase (E2) component
MTEVRVPDFAGSDGSVEEAELIEWHVESGERVAQGQEILQLELDKVTVAVAAPTAGVLHQVAKIGELVRPGDVVASIAE